MDEIELKIKDVNTCVKCGKYAFSSNACYNGEPYCDKCLEKMIDDDGGAFVLELDPDVMGTHPIMLKWQGCDQFLKDVEEFGPYKPGLELNNDGRYVGLCLFFENKRLDTRQVKKRFSIINGPNVIEDCVQAEWPRITPDDITKVTVLQQVKDLYDYLEDRPYLKKHLLNMLLEDEVKGEMKK